MDPGLGDQDLRLDYYLDGEAQGLSGSRRTAPSSSIRPGPGSAPTAASSSIRDGYEGDAYGYFDNVRAVYRDRIASTRGRWARRVPGLDDPAIPGTLAAG